MATLKQKTTGGFEKTATNAKGKGASSATQTDKKGRAKSLTKPNNDTGFKTGSRNEPSHQKSKS